MVRRFKRRNGKTVTINIPDSAGQQPAGGNPSPDSDAAATNRIPDATEPIFNVGDVISSSDYVDPATAGSSGSGDDTSRGGTNRGRPRGSRNKSSVSGNLTSLLFNLHWMGAQILNIPEMKLEESEAKRLNDAVNEVMQFYTDAALTPQQQAWLNLTMILGMTYGPRYMAYSLRTRAERASKTINAPVQPKVTPITDRPNKAHPNPPQQPNSVTDAMREWSAWNSQQASISSFE